MKFEEENDRLDPLIRHFGDEPAGVPSKNKPVKDREKAVAIFDAISLRTPRGKYNLEIHLSFLRLYGLSNSFKIQYDNIVQLFWLPESFLPHSHVVVSLAKPIQLGKTGYTHIVIQFETKSIIETTLCMNEDVYTSEYKSKIEMYQKGIVHEIFVKILRSLSGATVTRSSGFRSYKQYCAVNSSHKNEAGHLYPLNKWLLFLPKPVLIRHDEINYIEFLRLSAGVKHFDMLIKVETGEKLFFCNIQRNEYPGLSKYILEKELKSVNVGFDRIDDRFLCDDNTEDKDYVPEDDSDSSTDDLGELESYLTSSGRQVFQEDVTSMANDVYKNSIITFQQISTTTPRGLYRAEFHVSYLCLKGKSNEINIKYQSIANVFCLPKGKQNQVFVVVSLNPTLEIGKTSHSCIVIQFMSETEINKTLSISDNLYSSTYKDKLKTEYKGLEHEIFCSFIQGISGAELTTHGIFRSYRQGYAVEASLETNSGLLYPLEKCLFFLPESPTLIVHNEIEHVMFVSSRAGDSKGLCFHILVRLKTEEEHFFWGIHKFEFEKLYAYLIAKGLKIKNLENYD